MLPKRLKKDSIVEALFEVQFASSALPEVIVGRLADFDKWRDFSRASLPVTVAPPPVRRSDQNLKFAPLIELRSPNGTRLARIGETVLSYHVVNEYCGWEQFRTELQSVVNWVFDRVDGISVSRLGFRYVNALRAEDHLISSVEDLSLSIHVDDQDVPTDLNLSFRTHPDETHFVMTRIASPSFVVGPIPPKTSVVIDVDVATPDGYKTSDRQSVLEWLEKAHNYEKSAFFRLIPAGILAKLVEE